MGERGEVEQAGSDVPSAEDGGGEVRRVVAYSWTTVSGALFAVVFQVLLARTMPTKADYGLIGSTTVLVGTLMAVFRFGVEVSIQRLVPQATPGEERGRVLAGALAIAVARAFPFAALAFPLAVLLYPERTDAALLMTTGWAIQAFVVGPLVDFGAAERDPAVGALGWTLYRGAMLGFVAWSAWELGVIEPVPLGTALAIVSGSTALFTGLIALVRSRSLRLAVRSLPSVMWQLARVRGPAMEVGRDAIRYAAIPLLGYIYTQSDALFLTVMRDLEEVAEYRLGYAIASYGVIGFFVVWRVVSPRLAAAARKGRHAAAFISEQRNFERWAALTGLGGVVVAAWCAPWIFEWLLPRYLDALPLSLAILAGYLLFYLPPYGSILVSLGDARGLLAANAIAAVLNVVGNLVLIPRWGAYGAAVATALSFGSFRLSYTVIYLRTGMATAWGRWAWWTALAVAGFAGACWVGLG